MGERSIGRSPSKTRGVSAGDPIGSRRPRNQPVCGHKPTRRFARRPAQLTASRAHASVGVFARLFRPGRGPLARLWREQLFDSASHPDVCSGLMDPDDALEDLLSAVSAATSEDAGGQSQVGEDTRAAGREGGAEGGMLREQSALRLVSLSHYLSPYPLPPSPRRTLAPSCFLMLCPGHGAARSTAPRGRCPRNALQG